ncbi:hypothetical protein BaRGS_00002528, partial [Batillaria attramentaria]
AAVAEKNKRRSETSLGGREMAMGGFRARKKRQLERVQKKSPEKESHLESSHSLMSQRPQTC